MPVEPGRSKQIRADLGRLKLVATLPRPVRKFLSICLACLSIGGDLSIKSPGRPHSHLTVRSPEIAFESDIFSIFCTLEDVKLSSSRGFACY